MIVCPEFTLEPKLYDTVLPYLSIVALILNPYVIYCIIWRSTSQMKIYRWFLLYHQILTFITDISISFLTKPVILLPLPMGYNSGYLKGILSPLAIQSIFVLLVEFSFASILHLFAYRYETVKGTKRLFPPYMVIMMVIGYSTSLIVPITSLFMEQQSSKTVEMLRNNYTCATDEVLSIREMVILEYGLATVLGAVIFGFLCTLFIFIDLSLLYLSYKETNMVVMSLRLKKMQRRFLLQLSIQSFMPLLLVCIPALAAIVTFSLKIFGIAYLADMIFVTLSAFGSIGGAVLIAMNPTYYNWIYCFQPSSPTLTVSSIAQRAGHNSSGKISPVR